MAYSTSVTLVSSTTLTTAATTTYSPLSNMDVYREGTFILTTSSVSGTWTLNAYIQALINGTWVDLASFAQVSTATTRVIRAVGSTSGIVSSTLEEALVDGTLTAGTVRAGPWGQQLRAKIITTGSGFSVTVAVLGEVKA